MSFIGKFLCGIGLHKWKYYLISCTRGDIHYRYCVRCCKWQKATYDMAYGGTIYEDASLSTLEEDFLSAETITTRRLISNKDLLWIKE